MRNFLMVLYNDEWCVCVCVCVCVLTVMSYPNDGVRLKCSYFVYFSMCLKGKVRCVPLRIPGCAEGSTTTIGPTTGTNNLFHSTVLLYFSQECFK